MKKLFSLLILTILLTSSCARQAPLRSPSLIPKVEISERSVDIELGASRGPTFNYKYP